MDLKAKIRSIENYPQEGIIFRDITTLLKDAEGMKAAIDEMQAKVQDLDFDLVLGPESRGFIEKAMESGAYDELYTRVRKMEAENKEILIEYQEEKPGVLNSDNINIVIAAVRKKKADK